MIGRERGEGRGGRVNKRYWWRTLRTTQRHSEKRYQRCEWWSLARPIAISFISKLKSKKKIDKERGEERGTTCSVLEEMVRRKATSGANSRAALWPNSLVTLVYVWVVVNSQMWGQQEERENKEKIINCSTYPSSNETVSILFGSCKAKVVNGLLGCAWPPRKLIVIVRKRKGEGGYRKGVGVSSHLSLRAAMFRLISATWDWRTTSCACPAEVLLVLASERAPPPDAGDDSISPSIFISFSDVSLPLSESKCFPAKERGELGEANGYSVFWCEISVSQLSHQDSSSSFPSHLPRSLPQTFVKVISSDGHEQ